MRTGTAAAAAVLLSIALPATAHRLDEYLQATLISVDKNRVQMQVRLTPGVAVLPIVLAMIDTNADGLIAEAEQQAYAESVVRDFSVTVDGQRLRPRLIATRFPDMGEMKEGRGEIQLEVSAELPRDGPNRRLIFENHHQNRIAAYLVNSLVPQDPDIRFLAQNRNESQSLYQLDYTQAGLGSNPLSFTWWSGARGWLGAGVLLVFARLTLLRRERARAAVR